MTWWRRDPEQDPDQEKSQRQAERAIEMSRLQQGAIDDLAPQIEKKMSILARLNHENNFGARLAAAYAGQEEKL